MYRLVDVDLSKHRGHYDPNEPRDSNGQWTNKPGGAHLSLTGETRWQIEERDAKEIAKRVAELTEKAQHLEPGSTEYEHTWAQIASRLDELSRHAKTAHHRVHGEAEKKQLKIENAPKPVKVAHHVTKEYGEVAGTTALAVTAASTGAHVIASAHELLGTERAEQLAEAFHKFTENPMVEAGVIVAITLLLNALIGAIRSALAKRKAAKVEAARA